MANEVYVSSQGDTLATHILAQELEMLLHQRPFLRALAAYKGSTFGSGSSTIKVPQIDHDDIAESVAEGAAITGNTALTDSSYTLTPARKAIKRTLSDLLAGVDSTGLMREQALAEYNFAAVMKAFDADFCAALASLTGTVGTTGVAMSVDNLFEAQQTLRSRRVTGALALVLHPKQFNDLQTSLRSESGPYQYLPDVQAATRTSSGDNFLGMINDIQVWTTNQVIDANAGADHNGAMIKLPDIARADGRMGGSAALAYAEGAVSPVTLGGGRVVAPGSVIYTDFKVNVDKAEVEMVTNYFEAVSVADAAKGIKIITDHE